MSEIDDIFSLKSNPKASEKVPSTSQISQSKKSKKVKKRKRESASDDPDSLPRDKHPAPQTILDPSAQIAPVKRQKKAAPAPQAKKTDIKSQVKFEDSRGSATRKRTEEGWAIYKEDELGMKDDGGDTPLCPFDCDCCF